MLPASFVGAALVPLFRFPDPVAEAGRGIISDGVIVDLVLLLEVDNCSVFKVAAGAIGTFDLVPRPEGVVAAIVPLNSGKG